jgi:hypothetical protein
VSAIPTRFRIDGFDVAQEANRTSSRDAVAQPDAHPLRRRFARLQEFAVNPLLNSAGCHAHEVRVRLASRNCFADLELPFPQSRFHPRDGEFDAPAVHVKSSNPPFSLAARCAIVCHSIANSAQSCFDVGSDDSRERSSQESAFNRSTRDRSLTGGRVGMS